MSLPNILQGRAPALVLIALLLAACGSSSSSIAPPAGDGTRPPTGPAAARESGTARFDVDVNSGRVQVTPLAGDAASRAVFGGSAVTFNSSLLMDQPGASGLRVLNVSLTNRLGTPIGDGQLRVVLSHLARGGAQTSDLRALVQVSGTSIGLSGLRGLTFAADGSYLVARVADNRLYRVQNNQATVFAGRATSGYTDGAPDSAQFNQPNDIFYHAGHKAFYVTDTGNHRVRRVDSNGRVTTVAGTGTAGASDGPGSTATLDAPQMLDVDRNGALVVTTGDGRVRRITLGSGSPSLPASYTVATLASGLTAPAGVATAPDGSIYVAERTAHRIRVIAASGSRAVIAGTGTAGQLDGAGNVATFRSPVGVGWTRGGLVVADSSGHKIRLLTLTPGTQATDATNWRVTNIAGAYDGTAGNSVGQGNASRFNAPWGLRAREDGTVIFTDVQNNAVRRLHLPDGAQTSGAGAGGSAGGPLTIANASGHYGTTVRALPYFNYELGNASLASGATSQPQEWWFNVPDGTGTFSFIATVEAQTSGAASPEGSHGTANPRTRLQTVVKRSLLYPEDPMAEVDGPANLATVIRGSTGLAVAPDGVVYLTSPLTVRRYDPRTNVLTTIAGNLLEIGPGGGTGDTALFWGLSGVTAPQPGLLYVAEKASSGIYLLRHTGGDPEAPSNWQVRRVIGQLSEGVPDGTATSPIYQPTGIAAATDREIWFTDAGNRVCRAVCSTSNIADPQNWRTRVVAGDDTQLISPPESTDSPARFFKPTAIAVDFDGSARVADTSNHKIRRVTENGVVNSFAGPPAGTTAFAYVDGAAATARFSSPLGISRDRAGYYYTVEPFAGLRRISPTGHVSTVLKTAVFSSDGFGLQGTLTEPRHVAVAPDGDIWVLDDVGLRRLSRVISSGSP